MMPPSSGGLWDGVRISPSDAGPPFRFARRMAWEITGVGVYGEAASIRSSTPRAANTPRATSNAGPDSAWVSFPTNIGPAVPCSRRYSATARAMARMCASLNVPSTADPRCPEVPKAIRSRGSIGSGRRMVKAERSASTSVKRSSGTGRPASGSGVMVRPFIEGSMPRPPRLSLQPPGRPPALPPSRPARPLAPALTVPPHDGLPSPPPPETPTRAAGAQGFVPPGSPHIL